MENGAAETLNPVFEDILVAIYKVSETRDSITPRDIRRIIPKSRSNISNSLKTLHLRGYIEHKPYGEIILTTKGASCSQKLFNKKTALQKFFTKVLNAGEQEAINNACGMEHVLSDSLYERLELFFDFMDNCSCCNSNFLEKFKRFCESKQLCSEKAMV